MTLSQSDLGTLVVCSVRYALGRMTSIVERVDGIVREQWPHLDQQDRDSIEVAILGAKTRGDLGMECDARVWLDLLAWIEAQP